MLIIMSTKKDTVNAHFPKQVRRPIHCLIFHGTPNYMGFSRKSTGIMRIFTDQLNSHISKQTAKHGAQIFWWPSINGGVNGAKLQFVQKAYADSFSGKGNLMFCILTILSIIAFKNNYLPWSDPAKNSASTG